MTPSDKFPPDFPAGPQLTQIDPPHPLRSAWKTILAAAILVTAALGAYYYSIQKPPVAGGEVLKVNLYPLHTTISGEAGQVGMQGSNDSFDQLLTLVEVRVHNQTNIPLFLQDISESLTMPDGSQQMSLAAGTQDFDRVFSAYPALNPMRSPPLLRDITLAPGQTVEGLAVFNFPISKQQWDSRRTAHVVISFIHQPDLQLNLPQ